MRIVFFGTSSFAQIVLEKLISSSYKPALVVTAPDSKAGRGQGLSQPPVKKAALKNSISIFQPKDLKNKNSQLSPQEGKANLFNFQFELAILVAYGKIIPKEILQIPRYGFVNVHPSLLPKYRGPSPIQAAILAGEAKTGISIIKLDADIDHGPILSQKTIAIAKSDTYQSLSEELGKLGADLLIKTLPPYLSGTLKPIAQNHQKANFTKRITKDDGKIDLENPPDPKSLTRMTKAFYPWPGTWCRSMLNGQWRIIKFLPDSPFLIQLEGKKAMTVSEFKNGYKEARKWAIMN